MDHIFGDSHDIAFGGPAGEKKSNPGRDNPQKAQAKTYIKSDNSRNGKTFSRDDSFRRKPPRETPTRDVPDNSGPNLSDTPPLTRLITSMKASFLPKEDDTSVVRLVSLSSVIHDNPLMLVTRDDETLLIGSGFDSIIRAGKEYPAFPDMRLIFSEKDHISAWILTDENIDIVPFLSILPTLGFPPIYASRGIIARFRANITDMSFLEKCRFFELFSGGAPERRIGSFEFFNGSCDGGNCLTIKSSNTQIGLGHIVSQGVPTVHLSKETILRKQGESFILGDEIFSAGEILLLRGKNLSKHTLKFTFDTFYLDAGSVGVIAGYTLPDREVLATNGVLIFTLEEDTRARTIAGHIFIDSRGFVHAYEMMAVHKEILKGIRATYEKLILENERIERGELVQSLRREITKYCYVLTGRTPVVMPIVIER